MAEMDLPDIDLEGRGLAAEVQRLSYSILDHSRHRHRYRNGKSKYRQLIIQA